MSQNMDTLQQQLIEHPDFHLREQYAKSLLELKGIEVGDTVVIQAGENVEWQGWTGTRGVWQGHIFSARGYWPQATIMIESEPVIVPVELLLKVPTQTLDTA